MKFTKITDLKYGDHFIWADDYTRDFMCADEEPDRLAVLRFEEISGLEDDKLWFLNHNGDTDSLYFDGRCRVIVTQNKYGPITGVMDDKVRCIFCGDDLGSHIGPLRRLLAGSSTCPHRSDGYFAPNEESLRYWHPEAFKHKTMTENEFFESIGL
jgi:hypothetical protein